MPIYHLAVRAISRSAGRNAVAAAAYRAGARLRCDRTGRLFDYSHRHGVVATRIVVPQSETRIGRQALWDLAEASEKRCNSTVAREIEVALPAELDAKAREALALGFADVLAARYRVAVDVAIHTPSGKGDDRNYHIHYLTSTRVWTAGAFGGKVRQLDDRKTGPAEVVALRASWAAMCNAALTAAGVTDMVDHRSHRERGLPEEPGRKLGPAAVGLERRTGTVSRRRAEHDAERAANENTIPFERERSESVGPRDHGANRRQAHRAALNGLRVQFAAATAAAMAGRPHSALEGVLTPTAPQRRQGTAVSSRRPSASSPWSVPQVRPRGAIAPGIPASQVGKRKRQGYDEAAEAAAMYRRVDAQLEAEHRAQMAEGQAEKKRAAASVGHGRPSGVIEFRIARISALSSISSRKRPGSVASGPVRRPAINEEFDRACDVRQNVGCSTDGAVTPAAQVSTGQVLERRDLAIMAAHELRRRHKRSRARLSRLAEEADMDEVAFEAEIAAQDETLFDPAAIAGDPVLAGLWDGWTREDREKQLRDRRDRTDDRPQATAPEMAPAAETPPDAEPTPGGRAVAENTGDTMAASPVRPYTRRNVVIDYAITLIAREGWSSEVGDALAGLLRTRRGWVWQEAHRVCRARYGTDRPQSLSGEVLRTIRRTAHAGASKHDKVRRTVADIDRGRIGRGII